MKPLKTALLILFASLFLVGCESTVEIQKRSTSFPPPSLLRQYEVPEPPITSDEYAELPWDDKESLWVKYTADLLVIIKYHMADKAGIQKWEDTIKEAVNKINAEATR